MIGLVALAVPLTGCGAGPSAIRRTTTTSEPSLQATWAARSVPAGVGILNDVVCPGARQCFAVGGLVYGTGPGWVVGSSDGGKSWQTLTTAADTWFSAIACPTTADCTVVGGAANGGGDTVTPVVLGTTDSGENWANETMPAGIGSLLDVSCPSASTCVAVGNDDSTGSQIGIARTSDGGATWAVVSPPSGLGDIDSITCASSSMCLLGGSSPGSGASAVPMTAVTEDAGASWSAGIIVNKGASAVVGLSCASAQECVGITQTESTNSYGTGLPTTTSDGGTSWTTQSAHTGQAVSCVKSFCMSVGALWSSGMTYSGAAFFSNDGGMQWSTTGISTSQGLNAVTCLSSSSCIAVGGNFPSGTTAVIMTYED